MTVTFKLERLDGTPADPRRWRAEAGLATLTHVRVRDAGSRFSRLMNE
jgi:hypothetical protein